MNRAVHHAARRGQRASGLLGRRAEGRRAVGPGRLVWLPLGSVVTVLSLLSAGWAGPEERRPAGTGFSFGLIGDQRSTADERSKFPHLVADLNAADLAFTVHAGDIGAGPAGCADDYYLETRNLFDQFAAPLIYTPGDNEWTDCDGAQYDPGERLRSLRQLFFGSERSDGRRTLPLARQGPDYPENARWHYGPVTFATLHVVGSDDGVGRGGFAARRAANVAWLNETFDVAQRDDSDAIVFIWHADPRFGEDAPAYNGLRGALRARTIRFGKPVVLVHADGEGFRIDKPMLDDRGHRVENFTRVETFGPTDVHWVKGMFDRAEPGRFSFQPQIVAANAVPR
jgi:hypothetical protein